MVTIPILSAPSGDMPSGVAVTAKETDFPRFLIILMVTVSPRVATEKTGLSLDSSMSNEHIGDVTGVLFTVVDSWHNTSG